jgi:cob(I)alamin adenosyltransferase
MKIYTRGGDKGQTSLYGGVRVPKNHRRVSAYGTVDELNSALGFSLSLMKEPVLRAWVEKVQADLFTIGGWLASPKASVNLRDGKDPYTGEEAITDLPVTLKTIEHMEHQIDLWETHLDPLKNFILPGGGQLGASLHLARAICRRAERECVEMKELGEETPALCVQYLNRLADALFVCARYANKLEGKAEIKWT